MTPTKAQLCEISKYLRLRFKGEWADLIEAQAKQIAELEDKCSMLERAKETDPVCVKWYTSQHEFDQDRIAVLEAQLAFQKSVTDAARQHQSELLDRAEKAEAKVAALEKDAERYRWLRDDKADSGDFRYASLDLCLAVPSRKKNEALRKHWECFDAAIDAAIAASKEKS